MSPQFYSDIFQLFLIFPIRKVGKYIQNVCYEMKKMTNLASRVNRKQTFLHHPCDHHLTKPICLIFPVQIIRKGDKTGYKNKTKGGFNKNVKNDLKFQPGFEA